MIRKLIIFVALFAGLTGAMSVSTASVASAASGGCKSGSFLGFPAWYDGISVPDGTGCRIKSPGDLGKPENTQISRFISIIVLNVIQIMLMLVAYVSVGFIMYGGFKYLTSAGDSSGVAGGKKTVLNAIIGLVISFMSIAIVNLVSGNIK